MDRFQVFFMAKYMRREPFVTRDQAQKRHGLFICISTTSNYLIINIFLGWVCEASGYSKTSDDQGMDGWILQRNFIGHFSSQAVA
jgi:hypothetical protein